MVGRIAGWWSPFWNCLPVSTLVLTGQILGIFDQFWQFSRFQAIFSSNSFDRVDKKFQCVYIFHNFFKYLSQFQLFLMTKAQLSKNLCLYPCFTYFFKECVIFTLSNNEIVGWCTHFWLSYQLENLCTTHFIIFTHCVIRLYMHVYLVLMGHEQKK